MKLKLRKSISYLILAKLKLEIVLLEEDDGVDYIL